MRPEMQALYFENTILRFVGKRADGIATSITTDCDGRRRWIRDGLKRLERRLGALDTLPRHRELMANEVGFIREALRPKGGPSWALVDALLALVASLAGLTSYEGKAHHELMYFQTHDQFYASCAESGQRVDRLLVQRNTYAKRRELIADLKAKGWSHFQISVVFNISEHAVASLAPRTKVKD